MGERTRVPIPFGGGLDRTSGIMVVEASRFSDVRNVHLTRGRSELRRGLSRTLLYPAGTDLLGTFLIRAQGLAGGVVYDSATRKVSLYAVDSSAAAFAFVGDLWTLPAGAASPPRISATDSFDQLIIAHDEAVFPNRQQTMVYTPATSTLGPLMADFAREDPTGVTKFPVKFRGVAKYLEYIVGWGYGTHLQEDRGETLRISMPGLPTEFVPEHYLLVGQQGDAIIGGGLCNGEFAVQKAAQTFKLMGYDRSTFRVATLDPAYGLLSSRLQVSVNDEYHFWSLSGPRVTSGGATQDVGLPLELQGPNVDAGAAPTEDGFAFFDPTAREIVYCFGQWAYVLHLKDGDRRWSFRKYAVPLAGAGLLYVGGMQSLGTVSSVPSLTAVTYIEPSYGVGDGDPKFTVAWSLAGTPNGESAEVWVRPQAGGAPWRRKAIVPASDGTVTFAIDHFNTTHDVAVRLVSGGFAASGYTSADPLQWPAACRTTQLAGGTLTAVLGKWRRFGATQGYNFTTLTGPGKNQTNPQGTNTYLIEKSTNGGTTWTTHSSGLTFATIQANGVRFGDADTLTQMLLRVTAIGPAASSVVGLGTKLIAPEPPTGLTHVSTTSDFTNDHDDTHNVTWTPPAAVGGETPDNGPYKARGRHFDNYTSPPPNFGAYGATLTVTSPGVGGTIACPGFASSSLPSRTAELNVRIDVGGGDVSPWVTITYFEA